MEARSIYNETFIIKMYTIISNMVECFKCEFYELNEICIIIIYSTRYINSSGLLQLSNEIEKLQLNDNNYSDHVHSFYSKDLSTSFLNKKILFSYVFCFTKKSLNIKMATLADLNSNEESIEISDVDLKPHDISLRISSILNTNEALINYYQLCHLMFYISHEKLFEADDIYKRIDRYLDEVFNTVDINDKLELLAILKRYSLPYFLTSCYLQIVILFERLKKHDEALFILENLLDLTNVEANKKTS